MTANQDIKRPVRAAAKKTAQAKKAATEITQAPTVETIVETAVESVVETVVEAKEEVVETLEQSNLLARLTENFNTTQDVAKQVWFASLGAVGRTIDEVSERYATTSDEIQSRVAKLNKERQTLLSDLVVRGEKVQDEAQERLQEGRATVEEQIEVAKSRLVGLTSVVDIPARLQDLSDKLESLSKDLQKSA